MNSTTYIVANLVALVIGQWLVTRGHWSGFLVWCTANLYSIVTCLLTGMPQTCFLFGAYFLVNSASLYSWLAKARPQDDMIQATESGKLKPDITPGWAGN